MLLAASGRNAAAVEQLRKVIEHEPDYSQAHYSLGLLLAEDKDQLAEAAAELAEAVRLEPGNAKMRYNYGLVLQHLGKPAEAAEQLIAANRLSPRNPDTLFALAVLFMQQKKYDAAGQCANQLNSMYPNIPRFQNLLTQLQHLRAVEKQGKDRPMNQER
jgi:tetratricopeptide (TPR) repeat protein